MDLTLPRWLRRGIALAVAPPALLLITLLVLPGSGLASTPAFPQLVDVGGYRLFIDCQGRGSPTIVIDGGAGTWSIFYRHLQKTLAGDSRVCVYDRAGLGMSDNGPLPRTTGRMADELHRLLAAAGLEPPYLLVGHSLGGYTVRIYQRRHADEVTGLVLMESGHPRQWERLPQGVLASVQGAVPAFKAMVDAARRGELTTEHLDSWPFSRQGQDQRQAYEKAMLTPKPYETTGAEFASVLESAAAVPAETLGDLPLVVVTAQRSFEAFRGSGMPIEESNPIWLELQRELVGLSSAAEQLTSATADHNIEQSDPDLVVKGVRRALTMVRQRSAHPGSENPPGLARVHRLPHLSTPAVDALLTGIEDAYRRRDVEAFASCFADDVEQLDVTRRVLVRGRDGWRRQTESVNRAHRWMERVHHGRILAGNRLIVEIEWAGCVRGEALGTPGRDREYRYGGLGIMDLREGKVVSQILYGDVTTLDEQLGQSAHVPWTKVLSGEGG